MERVCCLVLVLLCGGLVSCTSSPPANIETTVNVLDPVVTRMMTFKDIYAREVEEPLIALLQTEGQVMIYPKPNIATSKTLLIKAQASTLEIIFDTMQDELDYSQDTSLLLTTDTGVSERTPLLLTENTESENFPSGDTEASEAAKVNDELDKISEKGNRGRQTYIYHVRHSTASALKRLLDEVYEVTEKKPEDRKSYEEMEALPPRFITSDVAIDREEFSLGGGWDNLRDIPGAVGNFLIILATPEQYTDIRELLEEIDSQPLQVFLNMLIAEITLLDEEVFGIEETLFGQKQLSIGGESNPLITLFSTEFQEVADNLEGFRYAILAPGRFLVKLRALVTENRVRLLSNPHIFVRNNRKAKIHIGETIPVVTHETTSDGNVRETIDPKDTGITLAVVPSINPDGSIHLEIMQEVTDIGSENFGGTGQASFIKRQTRTAFDIPDDSYIMLGGLRTQTQEKIVKGIPVLKDIPLLGNLFRSTTTSGRKTELILLIRAEIVESYEDEFEIFDRVYEQTQPWLEPEKPYIEGLEDRIERGLRDLLRKLKREKEGDE